MEVLLGVIIVAVCLLVSKTFSRWQKRTRRGAGGAYTDIVWRMWQ